MVVVAKMLGKGSAFLPFDQVFPSVFRKNMGAQRKNGVIA